MTSDTEAIERAARAIVYLAVEWSGPERSARQVVQSAIRSLPDDVGFEFFAVEEDGPVTGSWLISHGWKQAPAGCGSLMWFERGRSIATELVPGNLGAEAIIRKTLALWGHPAAYSDIARDRLGRAVRVVRKLVGPGPASERQVVRRMKMPADQEQRSKTCDECSSPFFPAASKLDGLCAECAHREYDYAPVDWSYLQPRFLSGSIWRHVNDDLEKHVVCDGNATFRLQTDVRPSERSHDGRHRSVVAIYWIDGVDAGHNVRSRRPSGREGSGSRLRRYGRVLSSFSISVESKRRTKRCSRRRGQLGFPGFPAAAAPAAAELSTFGGIEVTAVSRFPGKKLPPHWHYVPSRREARDMLRTLDADVRRVDFGSTGRGLRSGTLLLGYLESRVVDKAWCFNLQLWGVPEAEVEGQRDELSEAATQTIRQSIAKCLAIPTAEAPKPRQLILWFQVAAGGVIPKCRDDPVDRYSFSAGQWWANPSPG